MTTAMTVKIPHTVELVTELNPAHPVAQRLLALPPETIHSFLTSIFKSIIEDEGLMEKLNKNNSYALIRFAKDGE